MLVFILDFLSFNVLVQLCLFLPLPHFLCLLHHLLIILTILSLLVPPNTVLVVQLLIELALKLLLLLLRNLPFDLPRLLAFQYRVTIEYRPLFIVRSNNVT